jgi:hypothetical protein
MIKWLPIIASILFAIGLQAHASDSPGVGGKIYPQSEVRETQQAALKPFYEEACQSSNSSCISVVEKFVKTEASNSTNRLHRIYRAYEEALPVSERSALNVEQINWGKTDLSKCDSHKDVIDRWSCIGWTTDLRSVELDRRLGDKLKDSSDKLQPMVFPNSLRKDHLGVFQGTPALYALNFDTFDLSQDTKGSYAFSFDVVGGNGHSCSGDGNARRDGNIFTRVPDRENITARTDKEGQDETDLLNRNCKLEIKLFPNHIEFDGNRDCVEYFLCGASPKGTFFRDSKGTLTKK